MFLQMPAVSIRLLLGSDNVERWSDQRIWDAALLNIEVVISTHAVLADALTHSFVKIEELKLIIYDEGKVLAAALNHHIADGNSPLVYRQASRKSDNARFLPSYAQIKGSSGSTEYIGLEC
jgi:hypothetical protein